MPITKAPLHCCALYCVCMYVCVCPIGWRSQNTNSNIPAPTNTPENVRQARIAYYLGGGHSGGAGGGVGVGGGGGGGDGGGGEHRDVEMEDAEQHQQQYQQHQQHQQAQEVQPQLYESGGMGAGKSPSLQAEEGRLRQCLRQQQHQQEHQQQRQIDEPVGMGKRHRGTLVKAHPVITEDLAEYIVFGDIEDALVALNRLASYGERASQYAELVAERGFGLGNEDQDPQLIGYACVALGGYG